jgi:4-alpha-glucanotransferase
VPHAPVIKEFLKAPSGALWKRIGAHRRAGVAVPLFFIQSKKSIGVGELPDLELLAEWCSKTGLSLIQLLPMNDVGFNFRPYDSESSFALEPMHLCLEKIAHVSGAAFSSEIESLRKKYPLDSAWFNTSIKKEKLKILKKMFLKRDGSTRKDFEQYQNDQQAWLEPYIYFKVLKEKMNGLSWEEWPEPFKNRDLRALEEIHREENENLEFQAWLQWQLYRQFCDVTKKLRTKGVKLLGDLPFLVSRDSADVWSHQHYFKLHLSSGAPPDLYFADGQEWGMPPYHWQALEAGGYDYFAQKLKYAENFYDLFRIDHFVGIFRLWTFPREGRAEPGRKKQGAFDPPDESQWEGQGRKILSMILSSTRMLPCAEDLGTVPGCSFRLLKEYALPGMEIQRWMRDWGNSYDFKSGEEYRINSIVTLSTHDMTPFESWWELEAGTVEEKVFKKKCHERGIPYEQIASELFELKEGVSGRFRWKKEIDSVDVLLSFLGKPADEVRDLIDWYRATYDEKEKFWRAVGLKGRLEEKSSGRLVRHALQMAGQAASAFCIHPLQDWLAMGDALGRSLADKRINEPGIVDEKNWRLRMPIYVEELKKLSCNKIILVLNRNGGRVLST